MADPIWVYKVEPAEAGGLLPASISKKYIFIRVNVIDGSDVSCPVEGCRSVIGLSLGVGGFLLAGSKSARQEARSLACWLSSSRSTG